MKEIESIWIKVVGIVGAVSSAIWFVIVLFVNRTWDNRIPWAGDYTDVVDTILMVTPRFGVIMGLITLFLVFFYRWKNKKWHSLGIKLSLIALWPLLVFLMVY